MFTRFRNILTRPDRPIGRNNCLGLPLSFYLFCLVWISLEGAWVMQEFKVSILVFFLGFNQLQDFLWLKKAFPIMGLPLPDNRLLGIFVIMLDCRGVELGCLGYWSSVFLEFYLMKNCFCLRLCIPTWIYFINYPFVWLLNFKLPTFDSGAQAFFALLLYFSCKLTLERL